MTTLRDFYRSERRRPIMSGIRRCRRCRAMITSNDLRCKHCGTWR